MTDDQMIAIIAAFAELEPNWDGYQGEPVPASVIEAATVIVRAFGADSLGHPVPTGIGGVMFDTDLGSGAVDIEVKLA